MPYPCHSPTMPFFSRPQHRTAVSRRPCCGLEKNGMVGAWHGHGMASVNRTWPHCVNQMGKTHSKPLACTFKIMKIILTTIHKHICTKCSSLYLPFHKPENLFNIKFRRRRGPSQMLQFRGHHTLNSRLWRARSLHCGLNL